LAFLSTDLAGQQGNRATGQQGNRATGQQGNRATGQLYTFSKNSVNNLTANFAALAATPFSHSIPFGKSPGRRARADTGFFYILNMD
jgi:hypothetical protein